jgi:hypothetical protein
MFRKNIQITSLLENLATFIFINFITLRTLQTYLLFQKAGVNIMSKV